MPASGEPTPLRPGQSGVAASLIQYTDRTAHTRHTHLNLYDWFTSTHKKKMLWLKSCSFKAHNINININILLKNQTLPFFKNHIFWLLSMLSGTNVGGGLQVHHWFNTGLSECVLCGSLSQTHSVSVGRVLTGAHVYILVHTLWRRAAEHPVSTQVNLPSHKTLSEHQKESLWSSPLLIWYTKLSKYGFQWVVFSFLRCCDWRNNSLVDRLLLLCLKIREINRFYKPTQ